MAATEFVGRAMGSELRIVLTGGSLELIRVARNHIARLESLWSRFLATSDISRINGAQGAPVTVDPATLTLLGTMLDAWVLTDGRYDPTILPALLRQGYTCSRFDPTLVTLLPSLAVPAGHLVDTTLDLERGVVVVPRGLALDPGGLGKGLAADLTVRLLLAEGAAGALVGIGGDLAVAGESPSPDGWVIGVEDPDPSRPDVAAIVLDAGGVATSSTVSRRWAAGGRERHHVIDPATGESSETDLATVTAIASTGWAAEAHATAGLLAGGEGVLDHFTRHGLSGVAVAHDGRVLLTDDLRTRSGAVQGGSR